MPKPSEELLAVLTACLSNARDLLGSAKAVEQAGYHNVAYHLATLSLEEMGKRALYQIQEAAKSTGNEPPAWQANATQDHVKKLFWCLYAFGTLPDSVDQKLFFEKRGTAADIHANRIAGLYVDTADGVLNIPSKAISEAQSRALIRFAEILVADIETETPREEIPQQEIDLQAWFLTAMDDPEQRKRIFTERSLEDLKELNNVPEWVRLKRDEIETEDASLMALAERELHRQPSSDLTQRKEKWKIRVRIETSSNSMRPAFLKAWNDVVTWIKLIPVQGPRSKDQLMVEFALGDELPTQMLWPMGFTLSLRFIIAINMATSGFWWWPAAPNKTKYYESIYDVQNKLALELDPGGFQVFERRRALTAVHAQNLVECFISLPDDPYDPKRGQAYVSYLGGLNFLALNSLTWRCEALAFNHFLESLRLLMVEAEYFLPDEQLDAAIGRFLDEKFSTLDREQHSKLVDTVRAVTANQNVPIKIDDVYFMKLQCETIFRDAVIPVLRRQRQSEQDGPEAAPTI